MGIIFAFLKQLCYNVIYTYLYRNFEEGQDTMFHTTLKEDNSSSLTPAMLTELYLNGKALFVPEALLTKEQTRWSGRISQVVKLSEN